MAALSLTTVAVALGSSSVGRNTRGCGPGATNHPIRVIPSEAVTIPPDWPLDDNGAIMCLTCHVEIPTDPEGSGPMLRGLGSRAAEPTQFCATCHVRSGQRNAGSMHWLAVGMAHVPSDRATPSGGGGVLDAQTRRCLSCHDGVNATESKNATPYARSRGYSGDKRRNHPVGVQYRDVQRPKDLSPLRPQSLLPQGVALPDGKVSCVSCHNLYAGRRFLLSVPIQGSELCLTCHDMR